MKKLACAMLFLMATFAMSTTIPAPELARAEKFSGTTCKAQWNSCKRYCHANRRDPSGCLEYCGREYPRCLRTGTYATDVSTVTGLTRK